MRHIYHYSASEIFCELNIYVCKMHAFSEDKVFKLKIRSEAYSACCRGKSNPLGHDVFSTVS